MPKIFGAGMSNLYYNRPASLSFHDLLRQRKLWSLSFTLFVVALQALLWIKLSWWSQRTSSLIEVKKSQIFFYWRHVQCFWFDKNCYSGDKTAEPWCLSKLYKPLPDVNVFTFYNVKKSLLERQSTAYGALVQAKRGFVLSWINSFLRKSGTMLSF